MENDDAYTSGTRNSFIYEEQDVLDGGDLGKAKGIQAIVTKNVPDATIFNTYFLKNELRCVRTVMGICHSMECKSVENYDPVHITAYSVRTRWVLILVSDVSDPKTQDEIFFLMKTLSWKVHT